MKYRKDSVKSIYEHALKLLGQSLSQVVELPQGIANSRNRGDLGSLVEKYYFEHTPPNNHDPDFKEAGLELKTTGLIKKSGILRAKERLVLTTINYETIVDEVWEESLFYRKCQLMLILFYLYSKELSVVDRKFVKVVLHSIPKSDIAQIKQDWESIRERVRQGKAHELSEGDTFYLAACRKGSGGENEALRTQPFSDEKARNRAFSFKPGYVNQILDYAEENFVSFQKEELSTIEEETKRRFDPFIDKTVDEISKKISFFKTNTKDKGFHKKLANQILNAAGGSVINLEKAGIEMKTIRLTDKGKPRESMSFPGFKYLEIVNENWEDSSFCKKLESKFLFVIFKIDSDGNERLSRVFYWNMPYQDRVEAMRVWLETKRRVLIDAGNLPKMSESHVAHVRPKARDGKDKLMTPQGDMQVKKSFWLNNGYIAKVISGN